ncbi:aminotransferase class I and II [Setomelanomma holmii]|uniref:serine C-palmitoyltransferase n=1 Tax=Setomelanomma holmii TaxID=210430 RepID=A0A9P4GW64_9PLEO|nr:aminotransferase class I and II [Setomelanomma holmii]
MDDLKPKVIVNVQEKEKDTDVDSQSSWSTTLELKVTPHVVEQNRTSRPPRLKAWDKVQEGARLTCTRYRAAFAKSDESTRPLSEPGRFNRRYVLPLFTQQGKNDRVVMGGQRDSTIEVRNSAGTRQRVIQAASHNYAGLYGRDMELHHFALDKLPVVTSPATQCLEDATHKAITEHFSADFCLTTSTGYGSNLLAFSAILNEEWIVILDEKSHNSLFVAAYQSRPKRIRKYRHNDMDHLRTILEESSASFGKILVATDGYSSMDGTLPDLAGLSELKPRYAVTLLADEAHSFLSLGATGRGCIELWNANHPSRIVDHDLIDVRTGTMSKAIGAVGGWVCGKQPYEHLIAHRHAEMLKAGYERITIAACVQTIHALHQPALVQRSLERLRAMAIFSRQYLQESGVFVYGDADSPILPVYAGRPSSAAKLSYALRKLGVLATPVSTPAVPFWESRVRVCLSAAFANETVCDLLRAIVKAAYHLSLCKRPLSSTECFHHCTAADVQQESKEAARSISNIRDLIAQSVIGLECKQLLRETLEAGHRALDQYGLGSGGARWITGTTDTHVEAEYLVARSLDQSAAMTYPDTYIGLTSTVAALCRPIIGFAHHEFFIPKTSSQAINDGLQVAPKKGRPTVLRYDSIDELRQCWCEKRHSTYRTILLRSNHLSKCSGAQALLAALSGKGGANTTIVLHDDQGLGGASSFYRLLSESQARLLIYGSFHRAVRLSGSYLAGDAALIEELRYTSRGYMFSTSQQPFGMAMIAAELSRRFSD